MTTKFVSTTCTCGRGKRSHVDLKCGHCRNQSEEKLRQEYWRQLENLRGCLQLELFGFTVDPVSTPDEFRVSYRV